MPRTDVLHYLFSLLLSVVLTAPTTRLRNLPRAGKFALRARNAPSHGDSIPSQTGQPPKRCWWLPLDLFENTQCFPPPLNGYYRGVG